MKAEIKKNIDKIKQLEKKTKAKVKQSMEKHPKLTIAGRRFIKIIGLSFILFSLVILVYVIFNYGNLSGQAENIIGGYGYFGMFFIAFLADILFQPLGPELPLITGLLGGLNPLITIFLVALGSAVASYFGYLIGKKYGEYGIRRLYGDKIYYKWCKYYRRYGKIALVIAALTPLPYVPFCWFSGILNMKLRKFFLYAILPRFVRILAVSIFILFIK